MKKLKLLSDQAVGEDNPHTKYFQRKSDGLDFTPYSDTLSQIILDTDGPFTIGVFGEWGTGKTSLMRMVYNELNDEMTEKALGESKIIPVWFNAWKYEREEHLIIPLAATIIRTLDANRDLFAKASKGIKSITNALRATAYGFSTKAKIKIPLIGEVETALSAKDVIERSEKINSDPILEGSLYLNAFEKIEKAAAQADFKVVIFIDDLDRCFPDAAIKLLEGIKLVLSQPNFIFVLGVARSVIEGYLEHRYKKEYGIEGFQGHSYLDKIVQLPFYMPLHHDRVKLYLSLLLRQVEGLTKEEQKEFNEFLPFIASAAGTNPRAIIRFINNLLTDKAINDNIFPSGRISISYFALSRSLQQRWSSLFSLLCDDDNLCKEISGWNQSRVLEIASQESDRQYIAKMLLTNKDLQDLLLSKFGKQWLSNLEIRVATTQFVQVKRIQPESVIVKKNYDVYLSYLAKDIKTVLKITDYLVQNNLRVYMLTPKEFSNEKNEIGITESRKHAFFISKGFKLSRRHESELDMMLDIKKFDGLKSNMVIPVLIGNATSDDIPWKLKKIQYLDLTRSKLNENELKKLVAAIKFYSSFEE